MAEIVVRTVSRHIDPASKFYMHDWTAGDVVCIAPDGTFLTKEGHVKHQQQNKTSIIVRVEADIPMDYIRAAIDNPDWSPLNKATRSSILYRSERIVSLKDIVSASALKDLYNKGIVNSPILFKGSYLDLFSERSVRTTLSEDDKSGSADNATYIIGPDEGADYDTFLLFEADLAATLTGPTIGDCDGSKGVAQETATITMLGTTTAADKYVLMKASGTARHAGKWDDAKQKITVTGGHCIDHREEYVRIDGLQIGETVSGTELGHGIFINSIGANNDVRLSNLIVKGTCAGTGAASGIYAYDTDSVTYIWNSVVYGFVSGDDTGFAGIRCTGTSVDIWNCTIYNNYNGIYRPSGATVTVKNCAVFNNTDDFSGTITMTYCASDDDHTGDSATNFVITQTDDDYAALVVDAAGGDFSIASSSSELFNAGTDDPGGAIQDNTDIAGIARSSPWDIGAWELEQIKGVGVFTRLSPTAQPGRDYAAFVAKSAASAGNPWYYYAQQ